jgi:PIN domain nuclease of toxin-antitoxin system
MADHLVDTHTLYWYLTADPRLGANALAVMQAAEQGAGLLVVPSIVLAELYYLNVKLGRPLNMAAVFQALQAAGCYRFVAFEAADVLDFDAHAAVPEMHDRIIVGVCLRLGIPCLTRDARIINSGLVAIVW